MKNFVVVMVVTKCFIHWKLCWNFYFCSALTSHVNVKIALWQAGGSVSRVPEKLLGDHGISSSTEREHTVTVPRRYLDDVVVVFSGWQQLLHGSRSKICLMSNYNPKMISQKSKKDKKYLYQF